MRTDPRPNSNTGSSPIAQRRIALGMTQQQLAEAIGSTQQTIAKWELGKRDPRISSLLRLADALNCTVDDLIKMNKEDKNMKGEIIVDLINREGLCFDSGVFDDAEKHSIGHAAGEAITEWTFTGAASAKTRRLKNWKPNTGSMITEAGISSSMMTR